MISFAIVFFVVRTRIARPLGRATASLAVIALLLPTLSLDAFSAAFFPAVFPNLPASGAGVFGGWMLICCAGGFAAVAFER